MRDRVFPHIAPRKKSARRDQELWKVHIRDRLGKKRLDQLTRLDIVSLQSAVLSKGRAPATVNHVIKSVRSSLNLAVTWGFLEKNVASKTPMLFEDNKKERYLTDEELRRLLDVLRRDRNRTVAQIVIVLMATGLRLNEALAGTFADVDLDRRIWVVQAQNSKSRRVRSVPINDTAFEVLSALPTRGTQGPLWVNPRTGRRQRNEARDELRAVQATRDGRRAQLTEFLRQGRKLYKQRPDDVREWWKATVKPWIVETSKFLEVHYGKAESEMFLSPSPPSAADIEGSVNPEHNRRRLNLNAQMEVLRRLLERFPV